MHWVLRGSSWRPSSARSIRILYRISLRSKSDLDVGEIARYFGGGGHKNAAGFSLEGSLNQVREKVLSQLEDLFTPDKS